MNEVHEGVVIGGPKAGQWWTGAGPYLAFSAPAHPIRPFLPPGKTSCQDVSLQTHTYTWSDLFGAWVHETLLEGGPEAVIRELLDRYKPLVTGV